MTVVGCDPDRRMSVHLEVQGDADGEVLIPANLLCDVVKSLPTGAVHLSAEEGHAVLAGGGAQFSLNVMDAADFPAAPELKDAGAPLPVGGAELAEALNQVTPAASTDDSRPILTGVLLEGAGQGGESVVVATDSYRLARRNLDGASLSKSRKVLIPAVAAKDLLRLLDPRNGVETVDVVLARQHVQFRVGTAVVTARLIPGDFPNYQSLIPDGGFAARVVVDKARLAETVARMRVMAQDSIHVRLRIASQDIHLKVVTLDVGQAEEALPHAGLEGDEMELAFNPAYLLAGLEAVKEDRVVLNITDAVRPVTLTGADDPSGFLYLLMPVRVE